MAVDEFQEFLDELTMKMHSEPRRQFIMTVDKMGLIEFQLTLMKKINASLTPKDLEVEKQKLITEVPEGWYTIK